MIVCDEMINRKCLRELILGKEEVKKSVDRWHHCIVWFYRRIGCGPMPNLMAALPNIGGGWLHV